MGTISLDRPRAAGFDLPTSGRRRAAGREELPFVDSQTLLREISGYCRQFGIAESTFGRLAVNDGKLVNRLRFGGRVTIETVERVMAFMKDNGEAARAPASHRTAAAAAPAPAARALPAGPAGSPEPASAEKSFRFYDNRQKYLLFVTTCGEKWVIADRVAMELANLHPHPPALRIFDAGIGDGTVLTRVMRAAHNRFPTIPFYVVGKEISLEDVRLALEKMPDRFCEHPASVLVITNMYYAEAPWLTPNSVTAATSLLWHEAPLLGSSAHEFEEQITALQPFLADNWRAKVGKSGNPIYEKPVVLVIYREDHRFLLDSVRPRRGNTRADFDLVIASQPYRARASVEFKAQRVLAPLAKSLAPGGRLIGIHSHGGDPGLEIIQRIWPDENPFTTDRHQLLRQTKAELGSAARGLNFNAYSDARSLFKYSMHTLPSEVSSTIGTSTLFAAWNAAIYVAQIDDQRLSDVIGNTGYLDATGEVLRKHGGLWFWDESYVISRKRDAV
jgi:SAM-dependent methyltransferase